jgi:hypothetical protein
MIMVPDRAERSVDVADVGLVENGSPADLFVNGIDHVHCTYLYDPATVISTKRLPLVLNAVGKDRFRPQIRPYARFRPLSSQFSYPPWRMVNILRGGSLGGPLSTKVRRQLRMVVATAVLSGSAKDEIRV